MKSVVYGFYVYSPVALWPLVFIVFRDSFVYAMLIVTTVLGLSSVALYGRRIPLGLGYKDLAHGLAAAALLYLLFYVGDALLEAVGLGRSVTYVYRLIESAALDYVVPPALAWIGVMEELYWRGGLMYGVMLKGGRPPRSLKRAFASAAYYTVVHVSTLNIALVAGALVAGAVLTLLAFYRNVSASMITHVLWLELLIIVAPLR